MEDTIKYNQVTILAFSPLEPKKVGLYLTAYLHVNLVTNTYIDLKKLNEYTDERERILLNREARFHRTKIFHKLIY